MRAGQAVGIAGQDRQEGRTDKREGQTGGKDNQEVRTRKGGRTNRW